MNRQEALANLVCNVSEWGLHDLAGVWQPDEWRFEAFENEVRLCHALHEPITRQDWLDAKDNKEQPYMPQVGEECEYTTNGEKWYICKPLYIGKTCVFVKSHKASVDGCKEYSLPIGDTEYRPIKTERDNFKDELSSIHKSLCDGVSFYEALYDAGYRKND